MSLDNDLLLIVREFAQLLIDYANVPAEDSKSVMMRSVIEEKSKELYALGISSGTTLEIKQELCGILKANADYESSWQAKWDKLLKDWVEYNERRFESSLFGGE